MTKYNIQVANEIKKFCLNELQNIDNADIYFIKTYNEKQYAYDCGLIDAYQSIVDEIDRKLSDKEWVAHLDIDTLV